MRLWQKYAARCLAWEGDRVGDALAPVLPARDGQVGHVLRSTGWAHATTRFARAAAQAQICLTRTGGRTRNNGRDYLRGLPRILRPLDAPI